jgi:hypothetical protein
VILIAAWPIDEPTREQRIESAEDRADQAAFDAWREAD